MKGTAKRVAKGMGTLVLLAGVGCAAPGVQHTYSGPARPAAELALLTGTTNSPTTFLNPARERLSFLRVDGTNTVPWYSPSAPPTAIYVLPGRHQVDVQYEHIHGVARSPVWVQAQSNRSFRVKVMNPEGRTQRLYFVIEDVTAQTLVGGTEEQSK